MSRAAIPQVPWLASRYARMTARPTFRSGGQQHLAHRRCAFRKHGHMFPEIPATSDGSANPWLAAVAATCLPQAGGFIALVPIPKGLGKMGGTSSPRRISPKAGFPAIKDSLAEAVNFSGTGYQNGSLLASLQGGWFLWCRRDGRTGAGRA